MTKLSRDGRALICEGFGDQQQAEAGRSAGGSAALRNEDEGEAAAVKERLW
jgi:hypothetical protein